MDVMRGTGADIGRVIGAGERADAELERFISRRHERRVADGGERAEEEAWLVSSRLQDARRRDENRAAWREYHRARADALRRTLGALAAHHEKQAKLLEGVS